MMRFANHIIQATNNRSQARSNTNQPTNLSSQHMLHLARPNPKRQRPKRPMSRRMTIPTNTGSPRQRKPLLRSNDMHNPLPLVLHSKIRNIKIRHIRLQLQHLRTTRRLLDETRHIHQGRSVGGGNVVIDRGQGAVGSTDGAVGETEALECLGGGHLVD